MMSEGNSLKQNGLYIQHYAMIYGSYSFTDVDSGLPLLIVEFIPQQDEHWELFLTTMMEIVGLPFAPTTTADHTAYLATLINDHYHEFCIQAAVFFLKCIFF